MTNKIIAIGSSKTIKKCQGCSSKQIRSFISLGFLPIANELSKINSFPEAQANYPTDLYFCDECFLVQLGYIIDPKLVFPPNFPYTSSTTKALRDNFAELFQECKTVINLKQDDLVLDIGSNDGNLLSFFKDHSKVLGVTPEDIGNLAIAQGIPTIIDFFRTKIADKILNEYGKAKLITSTNTFAHIPEINQVIQDIYKILDDKGIFITESHYLPKLIQTLQYDTIYHEHLRYYSLHSLKSLLEKHSLEVFHVKEIPTHGGSIRVYAGKKGKYEIRNSVSKILSSEKGKVTSFQNLSDFGSKVILSKLKLLSFISDIKSHGKNIFSIGAAARASTLINYVGLNGLIDNVLEVKGSFKIGSYMSGTRIPILEESILLEKQPEYTLILSWHIAELLVLKLREKGYKGKFIIPLPNPRIMY